LEYVRAKLETGELPEVYRDFVSGVTIITDYTLLQKVFQSEHASSRLDHSSSALEESLLRNDYGVGELASSMLPANWEEGEYGMGNGPYHKTHRLLRTKWAQASISNNQNLKEMIRFNAKQLIEGIKIEMGKNEFGIEPRDILMNASLNIITYFVLGETLVFDQPEFKKIETMITTLIKHLMTYVQGKFVARFTPQFMINSKMFRKIKFSILPGYRHMSDHLYRHFYPYIFKKMKDHLDTIDYENPRDFMDIMLIEAADKKSSIGYNTIVMTIMGLYIGGGDTVSNTIRWLLLILAKHPECQERCYNELIMVASNDNGNFDQASCPYTCAVLLESRRLNPVADSLPHQATADLFVDGYHFKKGTIFFGSLYAIMHNKKNFPEPECFKPERFLHNGNFINDQKVCNFSVGKRNCVGKHIAQTFYFEIAAAIITNFRLESKNNQLEADLNVGSINVPNEFKMKFITR